MSDDNCVRIVVGPGFWYTYSRCELDVRALLPSALGSSSFPPEQACAIPLGYGRVASGAIPGICAAPKDELAFWNKMSCAHRETHCMAAIACIDVCEALLETIARGTLRILIHRALKVACTKRRPDAGPDE